MGEYEHFYIYIYTLFIKSLSVTDNRRDCTNHSYVKMLPLRDKKKYLCQTSKIMRDRPRIFSISLNKYLPYNTVQAYEKNNKQAATIKTYFL